MTNEDLTALLRDDPHEFLRRLHREAEVGVRIAAARPGFAEVGAALEPLHDEFVGAVWARSGASDAEDSVLVPQLGARGAVKVSFGGHLNGGNHLVLEVADGYVTAVRDHLLGLARLLRVGGPSRAMLAIGRVLLDASVHVKFLLDRSISERERCTRAANIRLEALRQEIADAADDPEELESSRVERQELIENALRDGLERETIKASTSGPARVAWFLHPHTRLDEILRGAPDDDQRDTWRVLSSAVHAQERPVLRFVLGLGRHSPGAHSDSMVSNYLLIPIVLALDAIEVVQDYYGVVGSPVDADLFQRVLTTGASAAGHQDEAIRRDLGLE